MKAPVYIFEGTWWSKKETPVVLSYFQALAASHGNIELSHRTIRSAEDIAYYMKTLRKGDRAFVYFACHGERLWLKPAGARSRISPDVLCSALSEAKEGAIGYLHFGCCEMIGESSESRRTSLSRLMEASGARWVSGYSKQIDWLRSMLLDLALVSEFYSAFPRGRKRGGPRVDTVAREFVGSFDQLARGLGFSGMSRAASGRTKLFPARVG